MKTFIFRVNLGLTYCCEPKSAMSINMDANLKIYIREVEIYGNHFQLSLPFNGPSS